MSVADHSRVIDGVELEVWFQRYHDDDETVAPAGELLTRPVDTSLGPVEFFSALAVDRQIDVLEWHIDVKEELHERLGLHVSINIHNSVVERESDRKRFLDRIDSRPTPATFEFTEVYPMPPSAASNRLLHEVRARGHRSAVDDFGAGLNGLALLTDFDFDVIKLDRSLSFDLVERPDKLETLATLARMIEAMGKSHVVEGVEEAEVVDLLRSIGFHTFQGYFFDRPRPVREIITADTEGTTGR